MSLVIHTITPPIDNRFRQHFPMKFRLVTAQLIGENIEVGIYRNTINTPPLATMTTATAVRATLGLAQTAETMTDSL